MSILEDFGLSNICEAENGKVALELIKQKKFDLVLVDMQMPVMDGIALIRAIDALGILPRPHIAVVTGGITTALQKELQSDVRNRIDSFILKPFDDADIGLVLSAVANKKQIQIMDS